MNAVFIQTKSDIMWKHIMYGLFCSDGGDRIFFTRYQRETAKTIKMQIYSINVPFYSKCSLVGRESRRLYFTLFN